MAGSGSPMRVLLVLDSLAPGGAETSTVALLPHLEQRDVAVEVAVLHDRGRLRADVESLGIPLHTIGGSGRRAWVLGLKRLLGERRPDLVHTSLFEADVAGRLAATAARIPVVSTLPTELYGDAHVGAEGLQPWKVRASQVLDGATAQLTTRLHAVSSQVAATMAKRLAYRRGRIDVVYRGRSADLADDVPGFDRNRLRCELDLPGSGPVILAVARHERAKGIDRLIDALPRIRAIEPAATLLVAGRDGHATPSLERSVGEQGLGEAVRFLGHRTDIGDLLRSSDVFVLPSRREGLPGSLLEAMAAGAPIVANDLPQVREVVDPSQAEIVDAGSPGALADGVMRVLADRGVRDQRVEAARSRFLATFTLDASADGMLAFYGRSLGRQTVVG